MLLTLLVVYPSQTMSFPSCEALTRFLQEGRQFNPYSYTATPYTDTGSSMLKLHVLTPARTTCTPNMLVAIINQEPQSDLRCYFQSQMICNLLKLHSHWQLGFNTAIYFLPVQDIWQSHSLHHHITQTSTSIHPITSPIGGV